MQQQAESTEGSTVERAEATVGPAARGRSTAPNAVPPEETAPIRLERRGDARYRAQGQAVGTFIEPNGRLWLTRVSLVDRSESGMGVRSPVPVASGANFCLSLPGSTTPVEGVVAHARGRGGAYRLGLRCARRLAA